jgi:hypothetical protein
MVLHWHWHWLWMLDAPVWSIKQAAAQPHFTVLAVHLDLICQQHTNADPQHLCTVASEQNFQAQLVDAVPVLCLCCEDW